MQVKTPHYCETAVQEAKEQQFKEFIRNGIASSVGAKQPILLLVRSPACMAARALFSISGELAIAGNGAQVIFAGGAVATSGDAWNLNFDPQFIHETRLLRDVRYLDGHEQLVCGTGHVWFGDSMRREPDKRDAFSSYVSANSELSSRARMTFARILSGAELIYNQLCGDYSPAPSVTSGATPAVTLAAGISETLNTWRSSDRH